MSLNPITHPLLDKAGIRHGSEPLAMNPSVSRITGVMCSMARRPASKA